MEDPMRAQSGKSRRQPRHVSYVAPKYVSPGLERVHRGSYRGQPSLRLYIPKADGRMRPLGIASLEDKIVQMAVVWVLQAIYEEDFLGFFDHVSHEWLEEFVAHRVGDQRVLRLIHKWLKGRGIGGRAVVEYGGGDATGISPLLANVYLHYVLDLWVDAWRKRHAKGEIYIVRYADDFVMGFQYQDDAERLREELEKRLGAFGLELHAEKTRLIEFGRFAAENRAKRGEGKPETFDFLGFTHICGKRRKDGKFTVLRKTIAKRMRMKAKAVAAQGRWLQAVLRGHYQYYAVPGNFPSLNRFAALLTRAWLRALRRRSHKARRLTWARMRTLIDRWIPSPRILHPYPNERLLVTHPR